MKNTVATSNGVFFMQKFKIKGAGMRLFALVHLFYIVRGALVYKIIEPVRE